MLDQSFDTHAIRSVLEKKKGTAVYESYMGQEVLGSYVWLPRYQWGFIAEMETDEVMWPLKWIRIIGVLTTMMVGGVCLLMAYVVSRRVSMPIVQVADAAERMAAGELKQRIPFSSKDEVGRLARSFNVMAQQLSQSVTSLRQKEESLQKAYNELIAAQEQLLHSEKMAAIGELVTSVAHEMRSPLSSIKLNLQIIGRSLERETALFEHYQIAIDQVEQMERMFSDLLNYSKPLDIRRKEISVEDLVDKCVQELAGEIVVRNVAIERTIPEELPPIIGDPDKIEQVLVNVLKNALDASERNGKIDVLASTEEGDSGSMVIIAVKDHGAGISQRNLKNIFQPFFTTKKRGTGLGLAIVKKIMDAHRGDIAVSSEQGRGTTVRLAFQGFRGVK
jgi:signal transduction histidine kinase